jgi:hypothetical protein
MYQVLVAFVTPSLAAGRAVAERELQAPQRGQRQDRGLERVGDRHATGVAGVSDARRDVPVHDLRRPPAIGAPAPQDWIPFLVLGRRLAICCPPGIALTTAHIDPPSLGENLERIDPARRLTPCHGVEPDNLRNEQPGELRPSAPSKPCGVPHPKQQRGGLDVLEQSVGIEADPEVLDAKRPTPIDNGGQEGVIHVAALLTLVVDSVATRNVPDLARCPGQEGPALWPGPVAFGIALEHLRRVALRVERDGDEENPEAEVTAEPVLKPRQLGDQQGTRVGVARVDEGDRRPPCRGGPRGPAGRRAES